MRNLVLLVSLAVNLFLLGLIAGEHLPRGERSGSTGEFAPAPPRAGGGGESSDILPLRALETLPPDLRREARSIIVATLPESRALRAEIEEHRQQVVRLLIAPDLDESGLEAAVAAMQDAQFRQQKLAAGTIRQVLASLPDKERIALLVRVEEMRRTQRERLMQMRSRQQGQAQVQEPSPQQVGDGPDRQDQQQPPEEPAQSEE